MDNKVLDQTENKTLINDSISKNQGHESVVHKDHQTHLLKSEYKALFILTTLYFIQGISLGFWAGTIQLQLIEVGASFEGLALLSWVTIPFSLKILTAPIQDTFYNPNTGQRRTYIIPIQYLMAASYILISLNDLQKLINEDNIVLLTVMGIYFVFLAAQQDIAVDGWVLTSLEESNIHLGSSCQSIGQNLGSVFGSTLFITLNSVKFCNTFIYRTEQKEPVLKLNNFLFIIGIVIFLINLYIQFFTTEKIETEKQRYRRMHTTPKEQITHSLINIKYIFKNKHVQFLVFYLLTNTLGFQPMNSSFGAIMQQKGFPKELSSTVSSFMIPLSILIPVLVGKYKPRNKDFDWVIKIYKMKFIISGFQYLLVIFFDKLGGYNYFTASLIIIVSLISFCVNNTSFVIHAGFFNTVSDCDVGGTYLTFLASSYNFGNQITSSFALLLIQLLGLDFVVIVLIFYAWFYYFMFKKKIINLQEITKDKWSVSILKD